MTWYYKLLIITLIVLLLFILITYFCFRLTFYSKNKPSKTNDVNLPKGKVYNDFKSIILNDINDVRKMKYTEFSIKSFDNLTLYAKYYEYQKDAPIEIMFHGYRGSGERDLSTGVKRAFLCKRNALIIDQRGSGKSEGHIITFGIKERRDCLLWIDFVIKHFGQNQKIILTGISMGAATVLMASCENLPNNVIGILADCGYTTPKEIINKVIKDLHLLPFIVYPILKLGAKIFGKFNLEETSALRSVKNSKVPIIFIHGESDDFVPCTMSKELYDNCTSKKELLIIPNAPHGISYLVDGKLYIDKLNDFFK